MDVVSGASSLKSVAELIKAGVRCRRLSNGSKLHAKVYIFGGRYAVVTSANLTRKALDKNIEVGARLSRDDAVELADWFDRLWEEAPPDLDLPTVLRWERNTAALRRKFRSLREKVQKTPSLQDTRVPDFQSTKGLQNLFGRRNQWFVCNTNRRHAPEAEERMHRLRCAAAWESFNYPKQMRRVERGNAILMYRNRVGVIGVGRATGRCAVLKPRAPERVRNNGEKEWRVPVKWLAWDGAHPIPLSRWKGQRGTFLDVSEDRRLRNEVRHHFFS
jgi:hypothetical protein